MLRAFWSLIRKRLSRRTTTLSRASDGAEVATKEKELKAKAELDPPAVMTRNELARWVGLRVRVARHRAGLTRAEVAERINLAVDVYRQFERGEMLPSVDILKKLVVVLGVTADELLGINLLH